MADWQAIKTEYITTDTSYRKLAQKHGVGYPAICHRSKAEGWISLREQHHNDTITKTLDKISTDEANRAAKIHSVADKLLLRIEAMVDQDEKLDEKALRTLVASVKDLKEIQSVRSELDRQEQEARISKLRSDAQQRNNDEDDDETGVVLMPAVLGGGGDG